MHKIRSIVCNLYFTSQFLYLSIPVCYICSDVGKGSKAQVGACMQCNKSGCKQQFHVTCAQALGLLCEEAGNYLDNVKYCGYCQHHYSKLVGSRSTTAKAPTVSSITTRRTRSKLARIKRIRTRSSLQKKGGNVKTIPPYKPVTGHHEHGSSDPSSSPEKEADAPTSSTTATAIVAPLATGGGSVGVGGGSGSGATSGNSVNSTTITSTPKIQTPSGGGSGIAGNSAGSTVSSATSTPSTGTQAAGSVGGGASSTGWFIIHFTVAVINGRV